MLKEQQKKNTKWTISLKNNETDSKTSDIKFILKYLDLYKNKANFDEKVFYLWKNCRFAK
jgi:hypothetical protein